MQIREEKSTCLASNSNECVHISKENILDHQHSVPVWLGEKQETLVTSFLFLGKKLVRKIIHFLLFSIVGCWWNYLHFEEGRTVLDICCKISLENPSFHFFIVDGHKAMAYIYVWAKSPAEKTFISLRERNRKNLGISLFLLLLLFNENTNYPQ